MQTNADDGLVFALRPGAISTAGQRDRGHDRVQGTWSWPRLLCLAWGIDQLGIRRAIYLIATVKVYASLGPVDFWIKLTRR